MNFQEFIGFYVNEVNKISEKFDRIYEESKKWTYFNGKELVTVNDSPYRILKYHSQACGNYGILPAENGNIKISWVESDNNTCSVTVTNEFFDDFEKFFKGVKIEIFENNKKQIEIYQEYLRALEEEKESKKRQQYQEFLRLKEIYEPSLFDR